MPPPQSFLVNLDSEMYFWAQIVAEKELKLSLSRFMIDKRVEMQNDDVRALGS